MTDLETLLILHSLAIDGIMARPSSRASDDEMEAIGRGYRWVEASVALQAASAGAPLEDDPPQ